MTTPHKQHLVRARVLTGAGWLEGTFHLSHLHGFAQYLSKNAWYPLTDVVLAKVGPPLPFFQLARSETLLVVVTPSTRPHPTHSSSGFRPAGATFVLGPGAVDGTVQLPTRLRLSDFIDNSTGFIHVQGSSVRVWSEEEPETFDDLLLNPQRLVGVMEPRQAA